MVTNHTRRSENVLVLVDINLFRLFAKSYRRNLLKSSQLSPTLILYWPSCVIIHVRWPDKSIRWVLLEIQVYFDTCSRWQERTEQEAKRFEIHQNSTFLPENCYSAFVAAIFSEQLTQSPMYASLAFYRYEMCIAEFARLTNTQLVHSILTVGVRPT